MLINNFIKGTCRVEIRCKNVEKLINALRHDVSLSKLSQINEKTISFVCFANEVKRVKDVADKYSCEIISAKTRGLPVIVSLLKKRPGLVVGAVVFSFILVCSVLVSKTFFNSQYP